MRRQVWLLFFCLALMHSSIVGQAAASMAASIPAGPIFARPAFITAAATGMIAFGTMSLVKKYKYQTNARRFSNLALV